VKETDGILYQKIQSFSLLSNRPIDDVRYELYPRSPNTTKTNAISETLSNECSFRSRKAFVYNGMRYQLGTIEIDRDKNNKYCYRKTTATSMRAALACHARLRMFTRVRGVKPYTILHIIIIFTIYVLFVGRRTTTAISG